MTHPPAGPANPTPRPGPSKDLVTFEFPATGTPVRTVVLDGEPWFVARDVCAVLEIGNVTQACRSLDDDEYRTVAAALISTEGRPQDLINVVTESGLYSLILRSRKPEAKTFKRWVTHDVLPAIRHNGRYEVAPQLPQTFAEALELAARQAREIEAQTAALAVAAPKAQAWETLASGEGDYSVADAAKILARDPAIELGERRLFTLLRGWGWIYRQEADQRHRVYQSQIETGRLSEIPVSHYHPRTGELVLDPPQVRVTVKGIEEIRRRLAVAR